MKLLSAIGLFIVMLVLSCTLMVVVNRTPTPSFRDGVKYGVLYIMRNPQVDNIDVTIAGASNLYVWVEKEKMTNSLSQNYQRIYPSTSFDDAVQYGGLALSSLAAQGVKQPTAEQLRVYAYMLYGQAHARTSTPPALISLPVTNPAAAPVISNSPVLPPPSNAAPAK